MAYLAFGPEILMTDLFSLNRVTFQASNRRLLSDLTLRIPAGQVVALIGHNGSGKSTLLKLLAKQQAPTAGQITFAGQDLTRWRGRAFARELAYLPQKPGATDGMTVAELVALGRYPWHGPLGRPDNTDRNAIQSAIQACRLEHFEDQMVSTLSGGEAQRAWIAMMVAQETACLLLDEPTSALDIAHQIEVMALIASLRQKRGRSVVVVIHDLNMAARFADHIIALRQGSVVFQGTPQELMTPDILHHVTGVPMRVLDNAGGHPVAVPA